MVKIRLLLIWLLLPIVAHAQVLLPDLGDPDALSLSPAQERYLGQAIWQQFNQYHLLLDDVAVNDYLQDIGERLLRNRQQSSYGYTFFVVPDDSLNAFALPGGYIGVHRGLLMAVKTEDELASVLAHEIAHVRGRHIARLLGYSKRINIGSIVGVLAGAVLSAANPMAGTSVISSAIAGQHQSLLNFTRQQEIEADQVGLQLLQSAGYDPRAMGDFFETLMRRNRYQESGIEYLRSHPLTENRISRARQRASQYPIKKYLPDQNLSLALVQARLKVARFPGAREAVAYYEKKNNKDVADEYGLAMAYLRNHQADAAQAILTTLHSHAPKTSWVLLALAETAQQKSDIDTALSLLSTLLSHWPDHHAATLQKSEILFEQQAFEPALSLLLPLQKSYPNDPKILHLLSRIYASQSNFFLAHLSQAKRRILEGALHEALLQIEQASQFIEPDTFQKHELETLKGQVYESLAQQARLGVGAGQPKLVHTFCG